MRISDWSSDVCSSDLVRRDRHPRRRGRQAGQISDRRPGRGRRQDRQDQLQFAAGPRADRPQGRRRDRGDRARRRQILSGDQDRIRLTDGARAMKPQAAPLVTGYAVACVLVFVLLAIAGLQLDAIVRAGFIPARSGTELIPSPGTFVPFPLTPLTAPFLLGDVHHLVCHMVVLFYTGLTIHYPLLRRARAVLSSVIA